MISEPVSIQPAVSLRRGSDVAAGVALIALPFVTAIVKVIAPGWLMVFYVFGLVVFLPLFALVIVIAATGFFSRRAAFAFVGAGRIRAQIAAWLHPLAFLAATAVLRDAADDGRWASPLSVVLGTEDSSFITAADTLFTPLATISVLALIWLTVEWIRALIARKQFAAQSIEPRR